MRRLLAIAVCACVVACTRDSAPPHVTPPSPPAPRPGLALVAAVPDGGLPIDAAVAPIAPDPPPPADAPTRTHRFDGEQVDIVALGYDRAHALYAVGTTFGPLVVGAKRIKPKSTHRYSFLARFTPEGEIASLVKLDGDGDVTGMAVAADGSLVLVGNLLESVGPGPMRHDRADGYVMMLGPDGKQRWMTIIENAKRGDRAFANAVALDGTEGILVAGAFEGTTSFGGTKVTSTMGPHVASVDAFVARYRMDGTIDWVATGGGSEDDGASLVTLSSAGEILVAGTIGRSVTFGTGAGAVVLAGPGPQAVVGNPRHAFLAAYSRTGALAWAREYGTTHETMPRALIARADGSLGLFTTESNDNLASRHDQQFFADLDARGTVRTTLDVTKPKADVAGFAAGPRAVVMHADGTQLAVAEVDSRGARELLVLPLAQARPNLSSAFARDPDGRVAAAVQVGDLVEKPLGGGRISVSMAEVDAILMVAPSVPQLAPPAARR